MLAILSKIKNISRETVKLLAVFSFVWGDNMALAITFVSLVGAIGLFILAENKDEIWGKIKFKDDKEW